MNGQSITNAFKEATEMTIGWGVIMVLLGILAMFLPYQTGIGVSVVIGWIIAVAGLAYLAYAFAARGAGSFLWRMLIGIVYVVGGGYLGLHPRLALESFTLAVAIIFLMEGVLEIVAFFEFHAMSGAGWILFDGIVSLLLAYLIWRPWPSSSAWAIGILVGINLIVSGVALLMFSVTARKTLKAMA
jgi:uncharacterized membrane protein HdeD (DUF308 family)